MKIPIDSKGRQALRAAAALDGPGVARRLLSVLYLSLGHPVARVARAARVTRPTVYHWASVYRGGGIDALKSLRPRAMAPISER